MIPYAEHPEELRSGPPRLSQGLLQAFQRPGAARPEGGRRAGVDGDGLKTVVLKTPCPGPYKSDSPELPIAGRGYRGSPPALPARIAGRVFLHGRQK
jgi:hypothetical protein